MQLSAAGQSVDVKQMLVEGNLAIIIAVKLSDYTKSKGISYRTARRMWKRGELKAVQLPSGTVIIDGSALNTQGIVIYARISSSKNKSNLES